MYHPPMMTQNNMTLEEYLRGLGMHTIVLYRMGYSTGVPDDAIKAAMEGRPIAHSYAVRMAAYLSQEYEREILPEDIVGLNTINPGRERQEQQEN